MNAKVRPARGAPRPRVQMIGCPGCRYLLTVTAHVSVERKGPETINGAVCIGIYVRFYYFMTDKRELWDYPNVETGKAYELMADEETVDGILKE